MGLLLRDPYDHSLLCLCWAILRQSEQICNSRRKTLTATHGKRVAVKVLRLGLANMAEQA
jgi:hypothetical protein